MSQARNISWSAFASLGSALLDIIKISVLARILSPEEFGIFAIALVIYGFSQLFSESGIGNAIVSQKDISPTQISMLFNFVVIVSAGIWLLGLLVSPIVSNFYQLPSLVEIIPFLLLGIPLAAGSRIFLAMMQKSLQMKEIAICTLVAKVLGVCAGLIAALNGVGVYALVVALLATNIIQFFIAWYFVKNEFIFSRTIHWQEIKPTLSFSVYQLGEFNINFFARNLDIILITKFLGVEVSGQYSVLKNLLSRMGDVIVSTFSRYFHPKLTASSDQAEQTIRYQEYLLMVALFVCGAFYVLSINSTLFIELVSGGTFMSALSFFSVMCLWLAIRYITAPVSTLWLVKLKPQIGVYWNLAVLLLISLTIYLSFDNHIVGVIKALTVLQVFLFITSLVLAFYLLNKPIRFEKLIFKISMIIGVFLALSAVHSKYIETFESIYFSVAYSALTGLTVLALSYLFYRKKINL